jgi:hypothetical protein
LLNSKQFPAFQDVEMLLALPEHKVMLPPRGHASQNDLFVLARASNGNLISIMVEGKVDEAFGPTLKSWMKEFTKGKKARWEYIKKKLGLSQEPPINLRYQLFHRLVSAILEAERFNAKYAIMIVHSFSPGKECFEDYKVFLDLFGRKALLGELVHLTTLGEIAVFSGWAQGRP